MSDLFRKLTSGAKFKQGNGRPNFNMDVGKTVVSFKIGLRDGLIVMRLFLGTICVSGRTFDGVPTDYQEKR